MIASTQAIVLNTHKYGDTSLICNLFSKDYGKLNIISKGAYTLKNPNSAILQPMNYIEICYYYKSKRNIQLLKEASINNHFFKIKKNYEKLIYSYIIIDIINKTTQIDDACNIIFRLSHKVLEKINNNQDTHIGLYFIFFQLQLLRYLGYQPIIDRCTECDIKKDKLMYNYTIGQLVCNRCHKHNESSILINKNSSGIMKFLINNHIDKIKTEFDYNFKLDSIINFLYSYISFHIVDSKKMKSYKLLI